jgi:hypothetical protein
MARRSRKAPEAQIEQVFIPVYSDGTIARGSDVINGEQDIRWIRKLSIGEKFLPDLKQEWIYPSHLKSWCLKYFEVIG